jgi:hypothetical protein
MRKTDLEDFLHKRERLERLRKDQRLVALSDRALDDR